MGQDLGTADTYADLKVPQLMALVKGRGGTHGGRKKAGCSAKYLLDGCRQLKKGLEYNDKSWTLRRAANVVCGVDDDDRAYTNHELMTAVLLTQTPLVQLKLTQKAAQVRSPPPRVLSVAGGP